MKNHLIEHDKAYELQNCSSLQKSLANLLKDINKQIKIINKQHWLNKDNAKLTNLKQTRAGVDKLVSRCSLLINKIDSSTDLSTEDTQEYLQIRKSYMSVTIELT